MNPTGKKFISLFLVFSLLIISPALHGKIHFMGKPLPECKMFFITEVSVFQSLIQDYGDVGANCELGLMYNLNKRSALGATFVLAWTGNNGFGIKVRYRRWLNSLFSVDFSPGLLLWSDKKNPKFTGHVGLNYKDLIALIVQLDVRRYWNRPNEVDISLGIKFGSTAGSAIIAAAPIVLIVGFILLASLLKNN